MSTTRHLAEFAAGAPPDAVQAFWRLWFGPTSAPGKIQVDDLTTLMGGNIPDKGEQAMPAGFKYFHGSGYDAGVNRVYFSSRFGTGASPAGGEYRLVRINPDDLSSYSYYEGGANDIWADSLCVTGGKVYVGRSNYLDQTQTLVDVFDVDDSPPVLEATHNLGSYGRVESIDTDGTNLFVGTSDRKVVRCPIASLPTPSHATAALGASGTCHALRYDSQNSKVFVGMGGTDNLFRLAASDLTNEATASLSTGCAITDDMAVVTDYIYVGIEGAGGAGRIAKISKTTLSSFTLITANTQEPDNCYGVFEEPGGDYVWATWATEPGELTRVKVSNNDDQQRVWLASGEDKANEIVFCGSKDKFLIATWETPPVVVRLSHLTVDADDPVFCTTTQYSFWHPIRLYIEEASSVGSMKVWSDGANGLDPTHSNITIIGNVADRYQEPSQSELTAGNYIGLSAAPVDIFDTWTSGAKKTIAGSASAKGDVGTAETDDCFLVIQMKYVAPCLPGVTPTEVLDLTHEDYGRTQEKTATVKGHSYVLGAASLSASGTCSAAGHVTRGGAASLSAEGTCGANGTIVAVGATALSASGTLTAAGHATRNAGATLSAVGTLTSAGHVTRNTGATLSAVGTCGATGVLTAVGAADLSSTGTLTASGSLTAVGTANLSAVGTLTAAGVRVYEGAAVLAAAGVLTVAAATTLVGAASLSASGTAQASGEVTVTGQASLSAQGNLTALAIGTFVGAADLSAEGTLTAQGGTAIYGQAVLSAEGTLTTAGVVTVTGAAVLSAEGTLTVAAVSTLAGAADLSGIGDLEARGEVGGELEGRAQLSAEGVLTAQATQVVVGAADLSATGTCQAAGVRTRPGAASLSGTGTLACLATITKTGAASLSATGTLTAAGEVGADVLGAASLSATGTLGAAGQSILVGAADLSAVGSLTAHGTIGGQVEGRADLSATATLTALAEVVLVGAADLSATGTIAAIGECTRPGAADLSATGTLTAAALVTRTAAASLAASGTLAAAGTITAAGQATLAAEGTLTAAATVVYEAAAVLAASGTLTVGATLGAATIIELSARDDTLIALRARDDTLIELRGRV